MNISQDGTSKEGSCLYEDSMDMSTNETGLDPERKMKMQMLKNDLSEPPVHLNDDNRANQTQEGVQIPIEIEHVQTRKISNVRFHICDDDNTTYLAQANHDPEYSSFRVLCTIMLDSTHS